MAYQVALVVRLTLASVKKNGDPVARVARRSAP
jgi:hypothetical protein